MTDPRQTAMRDNFGAPLCTCPHADADEPYENHDRACVVRALKRPREVCDFVGIGISGSRIHADAALWSDKTPDDILADLQTIDRKMSTPDPDCFVIPLSSYERLQNWLHRRAQRVRRRARMARKRRRGWA